MPFLEDWYLWTRMSHKGYVLRNVDEYLVDYRVTNDTIKRRYGLKYIKCEINFFHARAREGLVPLIPNYGALVLRIIIKLFGFFVYKKLFKLTRRIF